MGVAIHIIDDVKNLRGDAPGKKRGDDIIENKKSLPVLFFLEKGGGAKELVKRCFQAARGEARPKTQKRFLGAPKDSSAVEELICALEESGAIGRAENAGLGMAAEASGQLKHGLANIPPGSPSARALLEDFPKMMGLKPRLKPRLAAPV
jgi:octaprenyl-diphosphate synthase